MTPWVVVLVVLGQAAATADAPARAAPADRDGGTPLEGEARESSAGGSVEAAGGLDGLSDAGAAESSAVTDAGAEGDVSDGGAQADADEPPPDWLHGDHLTSEWFGARSWLASHGVTFDIVYAVEAFATAPPLSDPNVLVNGHLDVAMTLDTEGLGLWKGGKFYVLGQNNHGPGINQAVGSVTEISNIEAAPYTQLGEFFFEQNLVDVVRFRLGKQDANREFGTPRFGGNFINNNFGMLPSSPFPSYPTNGLAAVVVVNPLPWLAIKTALFEGKPQVGSVGFDSAFVKDAGHFVISSVNVTHRFGAEGRSNGTTSVGFFRQQGQFEELNPQGATPRTFDELWGFFAQQDERIYLNDDLDDPRCFTIIPRIGWAQPDRFNMSLFLGLSVAFHGMGMREDDTVGIGAGYFTVNRQANGTPGPGSEVFVEVFYKWRFTKFMSLQPDLQYYRTPGGDGRDALLVGARLKFKL